MKLTIEIDITTRRCHDCGRWFGSETSSPHCPMCGQARIDRLLEENIALENRLKAQKAATARAANRKGRR